MRGMRILWLVLVSASIPSSLIASDAQEAACRPELSSGFEMENGALDLDSAARLAIDPLRSSDVMREIAMTAPLHYQALFGITAFNGQVSPIPVDPLSTVVRRDFTSEAALDVQDFIVELIAGSDRTQSDGSPHGRQVRDRIMSHSKGDRVETTRACAILLEDRDVSVLWVSDGTDNCVRLVRECRDSESFVPFSGLTRVELRRSENEFVLVNLEDMPLPVVGSDRTAQYYAASVNFFR